MRPKTLLSSAFYLEQEINLALLKDRATATINQSSMGDDQFELQKE